MDDTDDNGRDARGRWKKGHCPNLNGRPRKKTPISESDVYHFKQTLVDATIGGKPTQTTRHALLLQKMFEQALKGSVLIQRKLFERFEKSDDTIVEAELELKHLGRQILAHHDKTGAIDEKLYDEYAPVLSGARHHRGHPGRPAAAGAQRQAAAAHVSGSATRLAGAARLPRSRLTKPARRFAMSSLSARPD